MGSIPASAQAVNGNTVGIFSCKILRTTNIYSYKFNYSTPGAPPIQHSPRCTNTKNHLKKQVVFLFLSIYGRVLTRQFLKYS